MKLVQNRYQIDGLDVIDICEKYGSPVYVYDTSKMRYQFEKMRNAFSDVKMNICFACKALGNINILKFFQKMGSGLDAVSIQEVQLGLKAGFKPKNIIFTPNCVSIEEIQEGVRHGVRINIDNISILEQFGHLYGNTVPVGIRINPHIMAGGNSKISTGHIDSKFGISIYQLPHVLRVIETNRMKVEGLHMHTGSDILDVEVFLRGTEIMLETAKSFHELEYIDFGSGFKVPYKSDDYYTDIDLLGKDLTKLFKKFCKSYGRDLTLIFEPGKFLVSEAGFFFARVNVIKQTLATVFAGMDTGLNHLIRPMFYDAYHQIINVSNPKGKQRIYTVVGYICETDTFGWNRKINEIREGDYLVFLNAGAYCFTMASNYNGRLRPPEVMIHEGKDYLIRQRETLDDLLRNQVEVEL
ncbi:MAG: diaminopimelate decarboxylase [Bacteroidales bacterium]|nr:diaminopimelate decarboxylase [Bacteroidales bacterium]MBN2762832.1 diaminopimelate decarboxylase [Bacteroidales bacterium]